MEENYKIGIIYQIYNINDTKIHYIGSSFNDISIRWQDHVSDYNKYLKDDIKPASTIYPYFKEFDIKNFKIIELKEYKVIDKDHLKMYEQLYINKYKPVNRINPFNILADVDRKNYLKKYRNENKDKISEYSKQRYINNKEYCDNYIENNREKIKEYKARHYQKNKEKLAEKQKIYREINKVKVKESKKEYNIKNREKLAEKNKIYYNENKNLLNENNKIYREKNKEKISAQNKEKITCEICNTEITKCNYSKHIKTNKHLKKLENMDN